MKTTYHKFKNNEIYIPDWDINFLFIGTFNPMYGKDVPYYYGRSKNKFWETISKLIGDNIHPNNTDFFNKIKSIKIGCVDLIESVSYSDDKHNYINGKGYSDDVILQNNVIKKYNTDNIIEIIKSNNLNKVYFTRGKSGFRKEQLIEINKLNKICEVVFLSSPSPINPNRKNVLNDWKNKLDIF